jgi:hypothetical protein
LCIGISIRRHDPVGDGGGILCIFILPQILLGRKALRKKAHKIFAFLLKFLDNPLTLCYNKKKIWAFDAPTKTKGNKIP